MDHRARRLWVFRPAFFSDFSISAINAHRLRNLNCPSPSAPFPYIVSFRHPHLAVRHVSCFSSFRFSKHLTTSIADCISAINDGSLSSLKRFQTCLMVLHLKNRWPPSSSTLPQIGHQLASMRIPLRLKFTLIARLLCANLHTKCLTLLGHLRCHILFHTGLTLLLHCCFVMPTGLVLSEFSSTHLICTPPNAE